MPVILPGLEEHSSVQADLLHGSAFALAAADPLGDEGRLPEGVGEPQKGLLDRKAGWEDTHDVPFRPRPQVWSRRTGRLAVPGALFVTTFALQLTKADPAAGWSLVYVIPVLLVAQSAGARGGAAAGALGVVLLVAWAQIRGVGLPADSCLAPSALLMSVGLLAGGHATRLSRAPARSEPAGDGDDHRLPVDGPDARRLEALRLAGVGNWVLDLDSGRMEWSDEYRDLYGVDRGQAMTTRREFQELTHPEDRHVLEDAIQRIAADGTTVDVRYRITRPNDGAERVIRSHVSAQRAGPDEPRKIIGTAQDVTDLVTVLSPREAEMLALLADGLSGEEIAARLVLSPATVRTHVQNAMVKLGAHTRGPVHSSARRRAESMPQVR